MSRVFNFSPGPATMPASVLEIVRDELLDYQGSGMSIMEMSHRGKVFDAVYKESIDRLRKLASIPEKFDILYMTGGASTQFALIPLNFSGKGRTAGYVNTGTWSEKAVEQAKLQGVDVFMAASSQSEKHNHIPAVIEKKAGLDYLHITSNNTIYGTQYHTLPDPGDTKLVIDMSSDFLSRPIDWKHIGMAYAGTQKNAGPSGLTVVVIDREYYSREKSDTPTMFRYSTYGKNESMYNTPPTFQIYVFNLIMKWIESTGGLTGMDKVNQEKAKYIYDAIDASPNAYIGHSKKESRSLMNITFNLTDKSKEDEFQKGAQNLKLSGLKGHRSVGGFRASVYNAMPVEGCKILAQYMNEFGEAI